METHELIKILQSGFVYDDTGKCIADTNLGVVCSCDDGEYCQIHNPKFSIKDIKGVEPLGDVDFSDLLRIKRIR